MDGKWYFTYGSDDGGGWTEVTADSEEMAVEIFTLYHPKRNGFVACCSWYTADEFEKSKMFRDGNLGERCKEHIILNHFAFKEVPYGAHT